MMYTTYRKKVCYGCFHVFENKNSQVHFDISNSNLDVSASVDVTIRYLKVFHTEFQMQIHILGPNRSIGGR